MRRWRILSLFLWFPTLLQPIEKTQVAHSHPQMDLRQEVGWVKEPMADALVSWLRSEELLTTGLDQEFYRATWSITPDQSMVIELVLVKARGQLTKAVGRLVMAGGSAVMGCVVPYLTDSALHYDRPLSERRPPCADLIRNLLGDEALAKQFDQTVGELADQIIEVGHRLDAGLTGRTLIVFQEGSTTGHYWTATRRQSFAMDTPPVNLDGRLYVPIRYLEWTGLQIGYAAPTVTITSKQLGVAYRIGDKQAITTDGRLLFSDTAPFIRDGRTMIPIRFGLTQFCSLDWLPRSRTVLAICEP